MAATWTAASNLSANVVYAVYDANFDLLGYGIVNQQAAPNQFTDQGSVWDRLGTFQVTTGTLLRVYVFNSAADGQVCADAVRIQPVSAITVDNANQGSSSFSTRADGRRRAWGCTEVRSSAPARREAAGSMAMWTATVQPGLYDLAATWTPGSNLSPSVVYAVYDANFDLLGYGVVNQQAAANQFTDQGVGWDRLGTFSSSREPCCG